MNFATMTTKPIPEEIFSIKKFVGGLEKLHGYAKIDAQYLINDTELITRVQDVSGDLVIELIKTLMSGETIPGETHTVSYPANWWQHFKMEWFPDWAIKRWPVKMQHRTVVCKVLKVCPHLKVPKDRDHVEWLFADEHIKSTKGDAHEG